MESATTCSDKRYTTTAESLKQQLRRVWPAFFARHGNFTEVQRAAIPHVLAGKNVLVIAATAAGKTEAALAPLLERHVLADEPGAEGSQNTPKLCILYICPTRALVRDLYERLRLPLAALRVSLAMKSGDTGPVSAQNPPTVLITTPESTDSLLTRAPRLFTTPTVVVLDEIHLFDHSARGDHLRCLLRRIEQIRHYAATTAQDRNPTAYTPLQRIALSATVPDAAGVAQRYLVDPDDEFAGPDDAPPYEIVQVQGNRRLQAELQPMYGLDDLAHALTLQMVGPGSRHPQTPLRKALIFCNTRNEVEHVATHLRANLAAEAAVFVHYSNLDPAMRREVEDEFAAAPVALCVCTSTLELGIDIGSIDHVVLIGPPPSPASFMQRIGRSGRRTGIIRVLCLARSRLDDVRFRALLELAQPHAGDDQSDSTPTYHFRPSVLVQQTFSILKQSPTGGIRLADLQRVMPKDADHVQRQTLHNDSGLARSILDHLVFQNYLQPGRLGEWRSGPALDELVDAHEIYSNIGADPLAAVVVDAYTGRILAQVERIQLQGETFLLGGRILEVVWRDGYRVGVRPHKGYELGDELRFAATPFAVPLDVGQAVARHLGIAPEELCLLHTPHGAWLFHFWGDLYGMLLAAMLRAHFADELETRPTRWPTSSSARREAATNTNKAGEALDHPVASEENAAWVARANEHALRLPHAFDRLPPYDPELAQQELYKLIPRVTPTLDLGRFHSLLPPMLAQDAAMQQCDLPRFQRLYRAARIHQTGLALRERLLALL